MVSERAVVLDPQPCAWSGGAPEPVVLSSEHRAFVVFDQPESDQQSDGCTAVEFVRCIAVLSGFPNDEALHGHRLWGKGLGFYQVHEVLDSSWLAQVRDVERHHHRAPAMPMNEVRHYVLTFHDSTVEALAHDLIVVGNYASSAQAITDCAAKLRG